MVDVMTSTIKLTRLDDALDVDAAAGGVVGTGGCSGPPPSASAETENANTNAIANRRLFTFRLPPFSGLNEPNSIAFATSNIESLFVRFWDLRCSGEPHAALAVCDRLLEVVGPQDFPTHLRQANARGAALRDLLRFRDAYTTHLSARPFVDEKNNPTLAADHYHGLGVTFTELREYVPAFKALDYARRLYASAGELVRADRTVVNVARLYVASGKPALALALIDDLSADELRADAEIARALAYEAEGDKRAARRSIASALVLLSDSENEATRKEALTVMRRIEGDA
jgi:tetratricopeptide (TPR) repeat protein